jgi:hypothetical protein
MMANRSAQTRRITLEDLNDRERHEANAAFVDLAVRRATVLEQFVRDLVEMGVGEIAHNKKYHGLGDFMGHEYAKKTIEETCAKAAERAQDRLWDRTVVTNPHISIESVVETRTRRDLGNG